MTLLLINSYRVFLDTRLWTGGYKLKRNPYYNVYKRTITSSNN